MKLYMFFVAVFISFYSTVAFGQGEANTQVELRLKDLKEFKADILIVRTFEVISGSGYSSKLSISDGVTETWYINLRRTTEKTTDENLSTIAKVFNLLKLQGYRLIQTNSGDLSDNILLSNYIFEKKRE
ncbi:hypothetical protein [Spirosoma gilvum]